MSDKLNCGYFTDECKDRICSNCPSNKEKSGSWDYSHPSGMPFIEENPAVKISNELWPDKKQEERIICPYCGENYAEKGKELCIKCLEPKEQSTSDELIFNLTDNTECFPSKAIEDSYNYGYGKGYTSAQEKAKAEIQTILNEKLEYALLLKKRDSRIKELEQQISGIIEYIVMQQQHNMPNSEILHDIIVKLDPGRTYEQML